MVESALDIDLRQVRRQGGEHGRFAPSCVVRVRLLAPVLEKHFQHEFDSRASFLHRRRPLRRRIVGSVPDKLRSSRRTSASPAAANAVMQEQEGGGSIVNIASVSGLRPSPGTAAYGAAKAGLISLTPSLAVEWAPKVRVNTLSAGLVATESADAHYGGADGMARVAATVPLGRFGTPGDMAGICLFLASPLAAYVSGANLVAHGGGERPAFLTAVERVTGHGA